jgi:N-acetylneuraminate lyase
VIEFRLHGLVAAAFTPMHEDGSLNLDQVRPLVEHLLRHGVRAVYVCGSTGEGPLLTDEERLATAAAYVDAVGGRMPVVVQVGHSSLRAARRLAAHARQIGADAVSAVAPYYFKPGSVDVLIDCLAEIAEAAGDLPFYYYHIPAISGVGLDPVELLRRAGDKLPTLAGVKYTSPEIDRFQVLSAVDDGRFDVIFGRDEMLLSGLAGGARAAIGSTYNFAAPWYQRLMAAFDQGNLAEARQWQARSVAMIRAILDCGGQAGLKAAMGLVGPDCGPVRLPLSTPTAGQIDGLRRQLETLGFFDWVRP